MRFPLVVLPKAIRTMLGSLEQLQKYLLMPHEHHEAPSAIKKGSHLVRFLNFVLCFYVVLTPYW
jgi:hypothetical protein